MCARQFVLSTALLAIYACGEGHSDSQEVLLVSAAVSLSDALSVVAAEYERAAGVSVVLNLAGSDTLATQLAAGAPADVFVSADRRQMDRIENDGIIAAATRVDLLANQLVVIVPSTRAQSVTGVDDLRSSRIRRIAIGDPDSVPAGVYAKQYLESAGLWEDVRSKVLPTRDVRAALAVVAAGNAEVGIVYRTDVVRPEVSVWRSRFLSTGSPNSISSGGDGRRRGVSRHEVPRLSERRRCPGCLRGCWVHSTFSQSIFSTGPQAMNAELVRVTLFSVTMASLATLVMLPPGVALGWLLARRRFLVARWSKPSCRCRWCFHRSRPVLSCFGCWDAVDPLGGFSIRLVSR